MSESQGVETMRVIIDKLGGWPVLQGEDWDEKSWSLADTFNNIRKLFGQRTDDLFDIGSYVINLINFNPSIRSTGKVYSIVNSYYSYMEDVAIIYGANDTNIATNLNKSLEFELKLNAIIQKGQQLTPTIQVSKNTIELHRKFFFIQWLDNFHPSHIRNVLNDEIDSKNFNMFDELEELFSATSSRTIANFIMWRLIEFTVPFSSSQLKERYLKFQNEIDGRLDRDQSWKSCVDIVTDNLPYAVGAIYVKDYFKHQEKQEVLKMYNNIKDEFLNVLKESLWMEDEMKEKMIDKLKSLTPLIGFPGENYDEQKISEFYKSVKIDDNQYLETLLHLRVLIADGKFQDLYKASTNENDWRKYPTATTVTAFYSESDNTILISAGMLQNNVPDALQINYLNYGRIGFIIAHEIAHSFNQMINNVDTWSEEMTKVLTQKKECFIEQYNGYDVPDVSLKIDGKRTVIENIADNIGIKIAYRAYKRWEKDNKEKISRPIGLDFTPSQLFWIAAAQTWCEEIMRKITTDTYSIEKYRVIGPVSNMKEFSIDFKCSSSSAMNREKKCVIW
ncbi:unnamed protein product [Diamesa serratosioi]